MALYDYDPRESSPNIDVEVRARVASPWLTARPPASPRMAALGPWDPASLLLWRGLYVQ